MTDQSLTDTTDAPTGPDSAAMPDLPGLADAAVETLLTFEQVLEQAKLVERTARICVRGDLVEAYDAAMEELASLVDADGNVLSDGEAALADQARAAELDEQAQHLHAQMRQAMFQVRFRAMPDDEWDAFEKANRNSATGEPKDMADYTNKLIARCAVEPTLTVEQVKRLRSKFTKNQMNELQGKAYQANTVGGLDIPKSPSFLHAPKPPESATS